MSKSKRKRDPFRTLAKIVIYLAAVTAFFAAIRFGLFKSNVYPGLIEGEILRVQRADVEEQNRIKVEQHNAALAEYQSATQKGQNLAWPTPKQEGWDVVDLSAFGLENTQPATVDRATLLAGGLLLVNQWHPVPEDYFAISDEGVKSVAQYTNWKIGTSGNEVKLFPQAIDALQLMLQDAETVGLKYYFVSEGYRTLAYQQELFDARKAKLESRYSGEMLIAMTKKDVNEPGTSEYHSGLSFTMGLYSKEDPSVVKLVFQKSDQGMWFTENCWKYGFIFRFPLLDFPNESWTDKSYKTGVTIPLNLYRWVGIPHAAVMRQMDFCLEEYIEYLIQHPHLAVYENGTLKYEIFRKQVSGNEAAVDIQVPLAATAWLASLDNMGGVVTAYIYQ